MSEEKALAKRATPTAITELLELNRAEYVYRFISDGKIVTGISWIGAKALAEYFNITIVDADIKEVNGGFFGKAKAEWHGRSSIGGAFQAKLMKLRDGSSVKDSKAAVKALNKAQRNAILNLLPIPKYIVQELTGKEEEKEIEKKIEKEVQTWEVPSSRDPHTRYIVKKSGDAWECSCPQFLFRGEECKHIKKVKEGEKSEFGNGGKEK